MNVVSISNLKYVFGIIGPWILLYGENQKEKKKKRKDCLLKILIVTFRSVLFSHCQALKNKYNQN